MGACKILNGPSYSVSTLDRANLQSGDYKKAEVWVNSPNCSDKCFECIESSDGFNVCKEVSCPSPVRGCMDPSADNYDSSATFDDGSCIYSSTTPPASPPPTTTPRVREIFKNVTSRPELHSTIDQQVKDDYEYLRFDPDSPAKKARVEGQLRVKYDIPSLGGADLLTLAINVPIQDSDAAGGESVVSRSFLMPVFKHSSSGKWGYANPTEYAEHDIAKYLDIWHNLSTSTKDRFWKDFRTVLNLYESFANRIKNIIKEEMDDTLPKMIDDKLREFNFYSANDKGKQRVVFNDEDREEISRQFDDLIKKYPEDIAFIRAVVIAKGVDKKTEEPVVRLGSYYNNSDIELPFNSQMNGLGKLLDGGVIYFTIINNEGPDLRDFKIVGGDKIPEVEFNEPEKEEIALDNYTHGHDQEMAEMDEPFEEVMKKKEQKGLASLLEKGDVTDDLTKRQKEVLENLKKKGFKLSKPENADIYERVRVKSKEFNESINAWKPKGK